jgi:transposase
VHVACTTQLTWYSAHAKRGHAGIEAAGVLPLFTGTLVADAFACCQRYGTARALCNAHLPRDPDGITAQDPAGQIWTKGRHRRPDRGEQRLRAGSRRRAHHLGPGPGPRTDPPLRPCPGLRKGRQPHQTGLKKTFTRQVADRMEHRRDDILRFLHDLSVPFTNNQGEQDIRMVKVQMKTSGGRAPPTAPTAGSWCAPT